MRFSGSLISCPTIFPLAKPGKPKNKETSAFIQKRKKMSCHLLSLKFRTSLSSTFTIKVLKGNIQSKVSEKPYYSDADFQLSLSKSHSVDAKSLWPITTFYLSSIHNFARFLLSKHHVWIMLQNLSQLSLTIFQSLTKLQWWFFSPAFVGVCKVVPHEWNSQSEKFIKSTSADDTVNHLIAYISSRVIQKGLN